MAAPLCHTGALPRNRHNRSGSKGIIPVKIGLIAMSGVRACDERLLALGLESPSAAGLAGIELKSDWKLQRWPEYQQAIRRIQAHGIRVNGCFVLGLDGQTSDSFDAVYALAEEFELFDVQITIQTPFPGTPLFRRLQEANRLTHDGQWERCTLFDINYIPQPMSVDELREGYYNLAARLFADDITAWRRENFYRKYFRPSFSTRSS
jgi:radical SAM superfamily enzyme YgiQ (UPF0313 family)